MDIYPLAHRKKRSLELRSDCINQENDLFEWMTILDNMKIVSRDESFY